MPAAAVGAVGLLGLILGLIAVLVVLPILVWRPQVRFHWVCPVCGHDKNLIGRPECLNRQCERPLSDSEQWLYRRAEWGWRDLAAIYCIAAAAAAVGVVGLHNNDLPRENFSFNEILRFLCNSEDLIWTFFTFSNAALLLFAAWIAQIRFRWSLRELGLLMRGRPRAAMLGAACGSAVYFLSHLLHAALGIDPFKMPAALNDPLWILIAPALLFIAPLSGELFFRGMLYRYLRKTRSMRAAVFISSLLFAFHFFLFFLFGPIVPYAFAALGVVNTFLFERFRTLAPGTAAGAAFGLCAVVQGAAAAYLLP